MKIYIVVDSEGEHRANWSTGTRVWTRQHNALQAAKKFSWGAQKYKVLEFDLSKVEPQEISYGIQS